MCYFSKQAAEGYSKDNQFENHTEEEHRESNNKNVFNNKQKKTFSTKNHNHHHQEFSSQYQEEKEYSDMIENRLESQRFIDVAIREMNAGNYDSALKLLNKAKELYPNPKIIELQELIFKHKLLGGHKQNRTNQRLSQERNNQSTEAGDVAAEPDYTSEQLLLVNKINKCSNFYQVLGVSNDANDTEIKKSYKRLALQLHPDKNRAPGAVEAFKTVGNAVAVLTDERKRKIYNAQGATGLNATVSNTGFGGGAASTKRASSAFHRYYHGNTFEGGTFGDRDSDDFTAEELFNMFFGNYHSQTRPNQQRRAFHHAYQRQYAQDNMHSQQPSLAFGLILVLILISMMSSFFTTDSVYNLVQSR